MFGPLKWQLSIVHLRQFRLKSAKSGVTVTACGCGWKTPTGWWLKAEPCNRVVPQWQPVFYQGGTERRPVGFWGWVSSHKGPCQPLKAISTFLLPSSGQTHRSPAKSCSSHSLYFFQHLKASSGCSTLHPRGFKSLFKAKKKNQKFD